MVKSTWATSVLHVNSNAANTTKSLAVFITLYNIELEKSQVVLCDHVKQVVPSSWDLVVPLTS